jgi:hypothetical protein
LAILLTGPAWAGALRVPSDVANIQLAIDSAAPRDTVFVEAGVYRGEGNKNLNFRGKDIVVWGVDGPSETIIDCEGGETENARGFIFESGERFSAMVAGFTIRNGYQQGITWETSHGGGMLITGTGTNPTIKKCFFENNHANSAGGGVAVGNGAQPTLTICTFDGNTARAGGGGAAAESDANFVQCEFIGNQSTLGMGGGLRCTRESASVIRDCLFRDNEARAGGGLGVDTAEPLVSRCTFRDNRATYRYGGAVFASGGADFVMSECLFRDNEAPLEGGAVCSDLAATLALSSCTFCGNSAPLGSGIRVGDQTRVTVTQSIISFGLQGEAVACTGSGEIDTSCCDIFGNEGGDWVGCIEPDAGTCGNMSADPLFCNVGHRDLHLAETSPCAAGATGCGLIGSLDVACTSAVEMATWGGVKALYRR